MTLRLVEIDDVPPLTRLVAANREFMAPWDPVRPDDFYTEDGQRAAVEGVLALHRAGLAHPCLIVAGTEIVGRITLSGIERGAFQSGRLGYWVSEDANGRGLASAAVAQMVTIGFGQLGLHRVEAGTLVHNTRSQHVLARNGFTPFGLAPAYCKIAGSWQDHRLYQRVRPE